MGHHSEALQVLRQHRIPYHSGADGVAALMRKGEIDLNALRNLGFRVSNQIEGQLIVTYKGSRVALIV
jgi:hypothetical protein